MEGALANRDLPIRQGTMRDIDESAGDPQKYGIRGGLLERTQARRCIAGFSTPLKGSS
jgi:hypothetical protein